MSEAMAMYHLGRAEVLIEQLTEMVEETEAMLGWDEDGNAVTPDGETT